jgi:hypothetical protein
MSIQYMSASVPKTLLALITILGVPAFADLTKAPQLPMGSRAKDPVFVHPPAILVPAVPRVAIGSLDACNASLEEATQEANAELKTWKARIKAIRRRITRNEIVSSDLLALQEEQARASAARKELQGSAIACLAVATLAHASGVPDNNLEKWPPLVAVNDSLNDFDDVSRASQRVAQRARKTLRHSKGFTAHK